VKGWLSGVRGTIAMTLIWTVGWGLGFGGLIELLVDPHGEIEDVWLTVMAVPGFLGGVLFCALLRLAEGRRAFDQVSLARGAIWGAMTGLVLGVLGVVTGVGSARPPAAAAMIGTAAALGAVAAIGSAIFFRLVARRQAPAVAGPPA
jgi:hypothetical protein